ncbi:outer membrane usher protein [Enterobacter bugandensis]|uniref:outer membrane usher protein n=1 Tax=Enterobacter bugandensis TaxID=881260 RepID=UPI0010A4C174|nr:outer membrane usher protein [Enterobacter bugandensis]THE50161.1 outer membrane usher protein [Enterobacter bugandensis]
MKILGRKVGNKKAIQCTYPKSLLAFSILLSLSKIAYAAEDVQFNTDVLDVKDKANIDLSRFSKGGYIMPGEYDLKVKVNQNELQEQSIHVFEKEKVKSESQVCLSPDSVKKFGLKDKYIKNITLWHNNECVDLTALKGVEIKTDLGENTVFVSVPQAYLEYTSDDWVPSSMWDDGIPGLIADYNVTAQTQKNEGQSEDQNSVSGNGTFGANLGAWRARADWQTDYDNSSDDESGQKSWTWNRVYLFRAIPSLGAKVTLGEDYVNSDIFDSFRYTGASIVTDDNMLPPNLRGYAPEVTGVARTNAKVTISQQGRVIYQTQVAAGPFAIQDLNTAVTGSLDVEVKEQDGSVHTYKVTTANVPYLTRPGSLRYKFFSGKPTTSDHHSDGSTFGSGEFSWGIDNGWSLYGGGVGSDGYQSAAIGIGRDLMAFGAIAFDVTYANAEPKNDENHKGSSYRVSYSKQFDETESNITFAGYRFAEKGYMSFNDFLEYEDDDDEFQQSKEMYTVTFSQQIRPLDLSAYLNYSHQTYWNNPAEDRYSLSLSRYMDIGKWKNINMSITAYRNKFNEDTDDGAYLTVSVPWGDNGTLSFNSTVSDNNNTNRLSYYGHKKDGDNYQLSAGTSDDDVSMSGYYDHLGDSTEASGNISYQQNRYSSAGLTLRGGVTATTKGVALHRVNATGGSRVMVDTGDAADIPIMGYGSGTRTNRFGKAVITDVSDYSKNRINIDINKLPENAEVSSSVTEETLTEGAIGYKKFNVISGQKAMVIIRLADGSFPPFGASVRNDSDQETGIVNDNGEVYLSGIKPGKKMSVTWNGIQQCDIVFPEKVININNGNELLMPCKH